MEGNLYNTKLSILLLFFFWFVFWTKIENSVLYKLPSILNLLFSAQNSLVFFGQKGSLVYYLFTLTIITLIVNIIYAKKIKEKMCLCEQYIGMATSWFRAGMAIKSPYPSQRRKIAAR
ncbi:hypothetical protein PRUPE_2G165400 [Prunus persica]|uniref:Uncharacterized protein n=1 Tax=Prunus persica TaxID=3760 RepID=A0A251QHZ7_PRUPE|nr:hypothetical protein PRUPE_2G165400 [Prunus persica]